MLRGMRLAMTIKQKALPKSVTSTGLCSLFT
jgi:hypothetical protein